MARKQAEKALSKAQQLDRDIATVAATEAGRAVFRHFMEECGARLSSVCVDKNGKLDLEATMYNESKRDLWVRFSSHIPHRYLVQIELPEPLEEPGPDIQQLVEEI